MSPDKHPPELVNIALGKVARVTVNAHKAVEIGANQMKEFEHGWAKSFYEKLSNRVRTQVDSRKHTKVGDTNVYDTELIFSRVIGIQASSYDVK